MPFTTALRDVRRIVSDNHAMRSIALLLATLATLAASAEDPLLGPADYIRIVTDSKLMYTIGRDPVKDPLEPMKCPRRDNTMRVVTDAKGERKLVAWNVAPAAVKLLAEAEKAFDANDYETAGKKYLAAAEADPESFAARAYYGDTLLFGAKDAAGALAQYEKAIALDPTLPSGHFFASSALVELGRIAEARERMVQALTYHPSYDAAWRALTNHARLGIKPIARLKFEPPPLVGKKSRDGVQLSIGNDGEWIGYAMCKAVWANEKQFEKQHSTDGWSLEEERACLFNQIMASYNATTSRLEEAKKPTDEASVRAAMPALERHLYEVAKAKMLDGYILFEIVGQHCPLSMSLMEPRGIEQVQQYIRRYVLVPAN